MIDYNATLQDFFAECQKFLKKRASRAKDETELQDIRYAISTVMRVKQNPEKYPGHVGDVSTVIRVALTGRQNTPDMYEIIKVLGHESVIKRLNKAMN